MPTISNNFTIRSFLLLLLFPSILVAQEPFHFESVSRHYDDAPNSHVFKIYEDRTGFIWFGTAEGLFRFDGYEFTPFRHDVLDSTTLSNPIVYTILEDDSDNFWIGSNTGLNKLDRNTGKISRFYPNPEAIESGKKERNQVTDVLTDEQGRLWLTTSSGLRLFDPGTGQFILLKNKDGKPETSWFYCLKRAHTGKILAGGRTGFWEVYPKDSTLERISLSPYDDDAPERRTFGLRGIEEDNEGLIWLNTNRGLLTWDQHSAQVSKPALPDSLDPFLGKLFLDGNKIWLSDFLGELTVFDKMTNNWQQYPYHPTRPNLVKADIISAFHKDHVGNLWLGGRTGISKFITDTRGIEHLLNEEGFQSKGNQVSSIAEDQRGYIYASTTAGIFRHNPNRTEILKIPFRTPSGDHNIPAGTMYVDEENTLWASLIHSQGVGIFRCRAEQAILEHLPLGDTIRKGRTPVILSDMADANYLWLGNYGGICRLNKKTLERTWYCPKEDLPDLPFNAALYLAQESDDILWLYYLAAGSLGRLDVKKDIFTLFKPSTSMSHTLEGRLENFTIDQDKNLWIATSFGLTRFHIPTSQFHFYTQEDGLSENKLTGVLPDKKGNVWVTGQNYLTKMQPKEMTFQHFNLRSSIRRPTKANYLGPNGQVLVGGIHGFYRLDPGKLTLNPDPPNVVLTDFKVSYQSYPLDKAPEKVKNIFISHRDNIITFEFVALHFQQPAHNQYRCKLEGFDEDWRELRRERKVTYTNLSPADYTFRVMAANSDGLWNEQGLQIQLTVAPAFWQTGWFRLMIALVILTLVYAIYKNRKHQVVLRQQKEIAVQANKFKSRFLANISHEIRTPMNAIIGLSKLMTDEQLTDKQKEYNRGVRQSSENLLSIINDLLDHSKIESGKFTFSQKPFDLAELILQIHNTLIFEAKEKGIGFSTYVAEEVPTHLLGDAVRLNQILMNLVGNAIKFTDEGSVELKVAKVNEKTDLAELAFVVHDTGIGIPADKLEVIFESFQQAGEDTFVKFGGTGLGLSISKELIEQQGGYLKIDSKEGLGTTISFFLSFEKSAVTTDKTLAAPSLPLLKDLRILLVEDTYFNQVLAVELLKKQIPNVNIELAENGKIALEKVQNQAFDLVLMDVKMPIMDGYEATRSIRKMPEPLCHLPILGLTANAVPAQLEACKTAGMNEIVTKPIDGNELFEKIQKVINL